MKVLLGIAITFVIIVTLYHDEIYTRYEVTPILKFVIANTEYEMPSVVPKVKLLAPNDMAAVFRSGNMDRYNALDTEDRRLFACFLVEAAPQLEGLFNPHTYQIYVNSTLDKCKRRSIIAHELTHSLQHIDGGKINPYIINADLWQMGREMEAYGVEEKYFAEFCEATE